MNIYPFTLMCDRDRGWSEYTFRSHFRDVLPKGFSCYGYDCIIHSPTHIEFVTYDMHDNFYGGVGEESGRFDNLNVPRELTKKFIDARITRIAQYLRLEELDKIEQQAVRKLEKLIRQQNKDNI